MPRSGADPYVPGHGDRRWSALHYRLDLDYKMATNRLAGTAEIRARLLQPTREIALDLYELKASRVLVDGHRVRARQTGSRLTVPIPDAVRDRFTVTVDYAGKPRPMPGPEGRAGWEELDDGVLVGSQPHGAPSWYPCNDRPDDKAPHLVTLSVESGYQVVGNGVLLDSATRSGRTRHTFEQREPMAPYLASVQIGRYATTKQAAGVPVRVLAPHGIRVGRGTAFERQGAMLDTLAEWFGPYPFASYTAVVTSDRLEIPLEAQGLSSFGVNHVPPVWENERLVVHELAHSWFGNSLTASTWADIWLHEGFACYAEWLWSEHRGLDSADKHAQHHWRRLKKAPHDLVLGAPGVRLMFDDRVYKRGALTLHALRNLLGDQQFFPLLRAWTAQHRHGLVTTAEFTEHLCDGSGGRAKQVRSLLDQWVYRKELPAL